MIDTTEFSTWCTRTPGVTQTARGGTQNINFLMIMFNLGSVQMPKG